MFIILFLQYYTIYCPSRYDATRKYKSHGFFIPKRPTDRLYFDIPPEVVVLLYLQLMPYSCNTITEHIVIILRVKIIKNIL